MGHNCFVAPPVHYVTEEIKRAGYTFIGTPSPLALFPSLNQISLLFSGNGRLASVGTIIGFIVMMSLDVGLG